MCPYLLHPPDRRHITTYMIILHYYLIIAIQEERRFKIYTQRVEQVWPSRRLIHCHLWTTGAGQLEN